MPALGRAKKKGRKFQNPVETRVGGLSMLMKVLRLYKTNKEERVPRQALGPFRTNACVYERAPASGLRVTWMGHSSMLIEIDDLRVLVDPVWDERASAARWIGPKRFFGSPLSLAELPAIDAVLVSHDHYDHLGKQTIRKLAQLEAVSKARWVTSLGVGKWLRSFGVREEKITELDWTQSVTVTGQESGGELTITALPTRHFSGRKLWDRFNTLWSSVCAEGEAPQSLFRGGLRNVGGLRGDRPAVWAVRPDDARSGSLQRSVEINPHGTGRRGAGVCGDGWIGADDADPLGLVRPSVAWLEAADRTNHGAGRQGRHKAVVPCAGSANGSNRGGGTSLGLVAARLDLVPHIWREATWRA
jgi:beta-lactamase family protein